MFLGHVNDQIPNFRVFYNLVFEVFFLNTEYIFNIVSILPVIFSLGTSYELTILFFFCTVLLDPISCSLLVVGIPPHKAAIRALDSVVL